MNANKKKLQFRRYNMQVASLIIVFFLVLLPLYILLIQAKEHWTVDQIAVAQLEHDLRYLPILRPPEYRYKLALLEARKPEIAVVGSSTTLSFRESHFTAPAANLGRIIRNINDLEVLIASWQPPPAVIIAAEYWWFNPNWKTRNSDYMDEGGWPPGSAAITVAKKWRKGQLQAVQILNWLRHPPPHSIGLQAAMTGDGFDAFGSYFYQSMLAGRSKPKDRQFKNTFERIDSGVSRFQYADQADPKLIKRFTTAIENLRAQGIKVFTYTSPLAPSVLEKMRTSSNYGILDDVNRQLQAWDANHLHLPNNPAYDTSDCEFIDGFHPGEIASMRILLQIQQRTQGGLSAYIDGQSLSQRTHHSAGHVAEKAEISGYPLEVDHLALGCAGRDQPG